MEISREKFLFALESVAPGLAIRESIDQATCVVFKDGYVMTYNEELFCKAKSGLDRTLTGAVQANALIRMIREFKEEMVNVEVREDARLYVRGDRKKTWHNWDPTIVLPMEHIEQPEKWIDLHPDFTEAINFTQKCAEKDNNQFALTCIHIHTDYIEALSNYQLARWDVKSGVQQPILVRRNSIKNIVGLGMTHFCETKTWIHFRSPQKTILSCRRFIDTKEFPDVTPMLKVRGVKFTLPGGLEESIKRTNICTEQNSEENKVRVVLRPGKMKLIGEGITAGYDEIHLVPYQGPSFDFFIVPELLLELSKKHRDCIISEDKLKVDMGTYQYMTCIAAIKDEEK